MWAEPVVYRYISGKPTSRSDAWTRLLRYVGHWELLGFGYWVITDQANDQYIGELGFANYQREIEPSLEGIPEIGWALAPAAHGRGLASEAIAAILSWADQHFAEPTTACMIHPDNKASIRVAEKSGYQLWTETTFADDPTLLYRRDRQGAGSG